MTHLCVLNWLQAVSWFPWIKAAEPLGIGKNKCKIDDLLERFTLKCLLQLRNSMLVVKTVLFSSITSGQLLKVILN